LTATRHNDVHLIKAAQVWPFVDTVSRRGGSVVSLCRKAGLPFKAVRDKRGVVGEHSVWRFIEYASEQLGLDHLGYICAIEHPVDSTRELGGLRMRMAPTLEKLLEYFIEDVRAEATGTPYRLTHDGNQAWFHRELIMRGSGASWQTEQYMITVITQIVRLCAGPAWLPPKLRIASSSRPLAVPDEWADIDIEWGHQATQIAIEDHIMALPSLEASEEIDRHYNRSADDDLTVLDIEYLVDRQIWSGGTSVAAAANELGLSVATLKRRLRERGKTYSSVVSDRRLHWAKELLATTMPIRDIARALGYPYPGNFTRAFARMAGMTPAHFRRSTGGGSIEK
jgi:AraC-like DNA-binding protein